MQAEAAQSKKKSPHCSLSRGALLSLMGTHTWSNISKKPKDHIELYLQTGCFFDANLTLETEERDKKPQVRWLERKADVVSESPSPHR